MSKMTNHLSFIRKKPKAGLRIIGNTILTRLGIQRLRNTQLAITYNCNFNCAMCSAEYLRKNNKVITPDEAEHIWKEIKKLGVVHVDLTGGEPTVAGDDRLCDIIRRINRKNDVIISIATNGWLLNEERLNKYKKAGLDSVFISIHSNEREMHDSLSVKGSWDRAISGAKMASAMGFNVCINCVLYPGNFNGIEKLAGLCAERGWLLLINPMAFSGKWHGKTISDFHDRYYELLKKTNVRADTTFNYRGKNICPGGIEKWYVTTYGDVMQCSFVHVSYGNLFEESSKKIYSRMLKCSWLVKRSECKHLFDENFSKNWHMPIQKLKVLPVSYENHQNLSALERKSGLNNE